MMSFWQKYKWWIVLAVAILVGALYWWRADLVSAPVAPKTIVIDKGPDVQDRFGLQIEDQPVGEVVTIRSIKVTEPTWVTVQDVGENDEIATTILGAGLIAPGQYQNFSFTLIRPMESGHDYYLTFYADNGDREFSQYTDSLVKNPDQTTVAYRFSTIGRSSRGE